MLFRQIKTILRLAFAATLCLSAVAAASAQAASAPPIGAFTTKGAWNFKSAPKLHPPVFHTDKPVVSSKLAPGYFMVANFKNLTVPQPMVGEGGPLILDKNLQPVWFNPVGTNQLAGNLREQTYQGKPVLTWWQGLISSVGATTSGKFVVVDQHYKQVASITGQDGWVLSEHDFVISGHDAWVTAYKNVPMDLTAFGGPTAGTLSDSAVQEYDLKTGKLVKTWDALQHVPLSQSQARPAPVPGVPWDAYHINAIQLTGHGGFLTSFRNTWAAYNVDPSGNVQWTLSGNPKISTFALPTNAQFQFQHDVQLLPGNKVVMFDDACCGILGAGKFAPPIGPSRGLVLQLNLANHTGSLVAQYVRGKNFNAAFLGSTRLLSNGNAVISWGQQPLFSEVSKTGKVLLDGVWPNPDVNYRVYVQNWTGKPSFPPAGAVRTAHGKATVYASWDGATQVTSWRVLAGRDAKHLALVATKAKNSFETVIGLTSTFKQYKVQALDAKGHVLGTSGAFPRPKSQGSPLPPGY
ncbi:MAG TPA: arylsulfotransferase family protein [Solirubrobacteraceae bacterium]